MRRGSPAAVRGANRDERAVAARFAERFYKSSRRRAAAISVRVRIDPALDRDRRRGT
jgi:hypothetical protein